MRNWKVQTPMTAQLNQETIDYMIAYVCRATGVVPPGTLEFDAGLNPVHLLVKEKEFKYGKGKEYIAFTDGGKNQFGKDVKYVKFFYYYECLINRNICFTNGKGKEYIAFQSTDSNGKIYYYNHRGKMKPNDKTYTFGLEKARTFWNEKVKEGYTVKKNPVDVKVVIPKP